MKRWLVAFAAAAGLLAAMPETTLADSLTIPVVVTGGTMTATGHFLVDYSMALTGDRFSIDVTSSDGSGGILIRDELFPGIPYNFDQNVASPFEGSITYQGTVHPMTGGNFGPTLGPAMFTSDSFVLPATGAPAIDVTVPFSVSGAIGYVNSPTDGLVFDLSGTGFATAHATQVAFPTTGISYQIRSIDYTFTSATPTPEPATLLMFAAGLFGMGIRHRRRRD